MPAGRRSRRLTAVSSMRARCRAAIAMSCAKWRCAEGASWTRSTRPVSRDARHATCGVSTRRSMRTCSSDRLRHPPTRVHRVVRVCHACAMCRCACRSRSERALARVRRKKFRARCRIHASFFSSRALARISVDARVGADAEHRIPSTRAVHRVVHARCRKPAWTLGLREACVCGKQRVDAIIGRKKMRIRMVIGCACAIAVAMRHRASAILHQNSPRFLHKSLNITAQTNYDSP